MGTESARASFAKNSGAASAIKEGEERGQSEGAGRARRRLEGIWFPTVLHGAVQFCVSGFFPSGCLYPTPNPILNPNPYPTLIPNPNPIPNSSPNPNPNPNPTPPLPPLARWASTLY